MHTFIVAWTLVLNKLLAAMQHSLSRVEMRKISLLLQFQFQFQFQTLLDSDSCIYWVINHQCLYT